VTETVVGSSGSRVEVGAWITLATFAFAAVIGFIAVLDADSVGGAFGTGFGLALLIFLTGATVACALACLGRERLELLALASIVAAGLAINMFVLAIWLDIDSEAYGKIVGIAYAWSLLALVILGLALAVPSPAQRVRPLWLATAAMTLIAGVISSWLIASASGNETSTGEEIPDGSLVGVPSTEFIGDDELLRALGASLVLLASLWFGTLAADRLERARAPVTH
jgi:hypothetical protein